MANPLYDALFAPHAGSDRVFLHLQNGSRLSFSAYLTKAARYANALKSLEVKAGDRVAVQAEKSVNMLALYAACVQAGVIFLPLNTAYTGAELEYFINDSGASLVVCDPQKSEAIAAICKSAGCDVQSIGTHGSLDALAADQPDRFEAVARSEGDLAALLYTSGTTGRSKGAMLSQGNLLSNAVILADFWKFTEDDTLMHALPIFHTHGLFVATNVCLAAGAAMRFYPSFDAEQLIHDMPKSTSLMGVPTFYTRLLGRADFTADVASNMRLFISGSAPLLAETHRQFEERTGHRILERYGMTETNMNTSNPYEGDRRAGTVGKPLPGVELRVRGEDGTLLPEGKIGTLEVRGPNVFQGYWQMPEKTAEELREDGFFITGDLAFIDADGYVTIVGRGKDLIISGGFNIYPKEIELVLDELPGVLESAVIGVPHPDFGETPVAVLVAEPGKTLDLETAFEVLTAKLARFKHPRKLVVVDALPRNTMGKVQKNILRDTYRDLFA